MATRHGRSSYSARLRSEALEGRDTPAPVTLIDYAAGFAAGPPLRGQPAGPAADHLLLTDGPHQALAAWAPDRVHVGAFRTSFVFQQEGEPGRLGDGFTFAFNGDHDSLWRAGAAGAGLGYAGITDSVAVKFDLVDNAGEGGHSVGVFAGGAEPTMPAVRLDDTPIHLHAQHPIRADLAYDGSVLTVTLTDTVVPDRSWAHAFAVDIPAAVGGPTAYVGFTAGTGELFARQAIDSWTYAEVVPDAPASQPPQITVPPQVSWVSPSTVALTARVSDDGGADHLTYTWEVVSAPNGGTRHLAPWDSDPARPIALAHLDMGYGLYTFRLTVRDADGLTTTAEVRYNSSIIPIRLEVAPETPTVSAGGTVQFVATEYDEGGRPVSDAIAPAWAVVQGPGTIDEAGRYTAPVGARGPVTVRTTIPVLQNRGMSLAYATAEATVEVVPAGPVITGVTAVYDTGSVLSDNTVVLRATATDAGGTGALTYTWELVSASNGAQPQVYPSSSVDPTAAWVYLQGPGVYTFRVTVRDAAGGTTTDQVVFTHDPRYITSVELTPQAATVLAGGTVQFTPIVRDQYGQVMPGVRPFLSVMGPGTIDETGLYTAPPDVSGTVPINATIQVGPERAHWFVHASARVQILSSRPPDPGLDFGGGFAGADLLENGLAQVVGDRLRLADGPHQAGSAFAPTPVDVREFVARFEFQVGDAAAGRLGDGLTFVLQNAGPTALGAAGEGLGYQGIDKSVALKIDLVDNAGEGIESVGLYLNGVAPTVPAQTIPGGMIHLHSGHPFRVDLTYISGRLRCMVWDMVTGAGSGATFAVDFPAAVGGPTAYAGFTAGTGELFAPIDVLAWRHVPTDNWMPVPLAD